MKVVHLTAKVSVFPTHKYTTYIPCTYTRTYHYPSKTLENVAKIMIRGGFLQIANEESSCCFGVKFIYPFIQRPELILAFRFLKWENKELSHVTFLKISKHEPCQEVSFPNHGSNFARKLKTTRACSLANTEGRNFISRIQPRADTRTQARLRWLFDSALPQIAYEHY